MNYPEIYFDSDDVERGYYVYAHKCSKTNQIFYVGKGKEGRAWSDRRSRAWHEYVAQLEQGYDVLLLHEDLTEDEAIELERIEIEAQGGPASAGGRLINWIPGEAGYGFGVAATITLRFGDEPNEDERRFAEELMAVYRDARKFRTLTKQEKDNLAAQFDQIVAPSVAVIDSLKNEFDAVGKHADFPFVLQSCDSKCYWIGDLARQFRRRKISFREFCEQVDDQVGQLESTLREAIKENCPPDHIAMCQRAYDAVTAWCALFADGTREEAQSAADAVSIRRSFPPGEQYDEDFARYVAVTRAFFGDRQADDRLRIRAELIREADRKPEAPPPG